MTFTARGEEGKRGGRGGGGEAERQEEREEKFVEMKQCQWENRQTASW